MIFCIIKNTLGFIQKLIKIKNELYATVAQLVEQRIRNAQAVGSSPTSSSSGKLPLPSRTPHFVGCVFFAPAPEQVFIL